MAWISFGHKSCLNDKNECFDYVRRQNGIFVFLFVVCWCDTVKHESEPFNLNDNIKYIFSWIKFMLSERLNPLVLLAYSRKEKLKRVQIDSNHFGMIHSNWCGTPNNQGYYTKSSNERYARYLVISVSFLSERITRYTFPVIECYSYRRDIIISTETFINLVGSNKKKATWCGSAYTW